MRIPAERSYSLLNCAWIPGCNRSGTDVFARFLNHDAALEPFRVAIGEGHVNAAEVTSRLAIVVFNLSTGSDVIANSTVRTHAGEILAIGAAADDVGTGSIVVAVVE